MTPEPRRGAKGLSGHFFAAPLSLLICSALKGNLCYLTIGIILSLLGLRKVYGIGSRRHARKQEGGMGAEASPPPLSSEGGARGALFC